MDQSLVAIRFAIFILSVLSTVWLALGTSACGPENNDTFEERKVSADSLLMVAVNGDTLPIGRPFTFPEPESGKILKRFTQPLDSAELSKGQEVRYPLEKSGEFALPMAVDTLLPTGDSVELAYEEHIVSITESGSLDPPVNVTSFRSYWRSLTENEGLPSQRIVEMAGDDLGALWLSTPDGLVYYDGKSYELWDFSEILTNTLIRWKKWDRGWLWGRQEGERQLLAFDGYRLRIYVLDELKRQNVKPENLLDDHGFYAEDKRNVFYLDGQLLWTFPKPEDWSSRKDYYRFSAGRLLRYELDSQLLARFANAKLLDLNAPVLVQGDQNTLCREGNGTLHCFRAEELPFPTIRRQLANGEDGTWVQDFSGNFAHWGSSTISFPGLQVEGKYPNYPKLRVSDGGGGVWLSSKLYGLRKYTPKAIRHFRQSELGNQKPNGISSIIEDEQGDLWMGGHGGPLVRKSDDKWWSYVIASSVHNGGAIRALAKAEGNRLWIGLADAGLYLKHGNQLTAFDLLPNTKQETVYALTMDKQGYLWIGFGKQGLARWDGHELLRYRLAGNDNFGESNTVRSLLCDENENVWIASQGGGLWRFDGRQFTFFTTTEGLSSNKLLSLFEDSRGRIWIGTQDAGVMVYDGDSFTKFDEKTGLSSNTIYTIAEDEEGHIWLGADDCLNRLDFKTSQTEGLPGYDADLGLTVSVICDLDGVRNDEFFSDASLMDRKGNLWWGGATALHSARTSELFPQEAPPELSLVNIRLENARIDFGQDLSDIRYDSLIGRRNLPVGLDLPTEQNALSFHFSPGNHPLKEHCQFTFRLLGAETEWTKARNEPVAEYRGLAAGSYTLEASVAGRNGIWSEPLRYDFSIRHPWWQRYWAISLWSLLLAFVTYRIYRLVLKRRLRYAEASKVLELDEFKTRFYTNITHEFRTPLTVILGMNERLEGNPEAKTLIKRNADKLLRLINQLLDLSKIESGNLPLKLVNTDLVAHCRYLTESFYSLAEEKRQRLVFFAEVDKLITAIDEEKVQYIFLNLLSNAVKFTPEGGQVLVQLSMAGDKIRLVVRDNGIGISPEKLPRIFERFYQVEGDSMRHGEGSGIGLAFTKELVKLMDGDIKAVSKPGKGTTIIVELPLLKQEGDLDKRNSFGFHSRPARPNGRQGSKVIDNAEVVSQATILTDEPMTVLAGDESETAPENEPVLLLVEDNADLVNYIQRLVHDKYHLLLARDGRQGLEMATKEVPDIIVSDVMMPVMDGFQFCAAIKQDTRTSHIPVILLTAKSTQSDKVRGLGFGADAYLAKPFDEQEFFIRIEKLIELRAALQKRYSGFNSIEQDTSSNPEEVFLRELTTVIETRLDDAEMTIPEVARALALSQTQLYRKLKALTGKTPSQFVRLVRLKKGALLLCQPGKSIAEIAYAVGFSDPNYFSKTFNDAFGKSPSDYRKAL
ncbi:hypothetical protein CEQ90_00690 [Lewinellaceae bacterium SD302]|nr:hypothetical protein CEQ90_00690 [Lewinellaceae bacterium SD302]